jgi:hypothetical protein
MTRSISVAGAILLASALWGCVKPTEEPGAGAKVCTDQRCEIAIGIKDCKGGGRCFRTDEEVHVKTRAGTAPLRDVHLTWTVPQGFGFCDGANDGIVFNPPSPQMSNGHASDNGVDPPANPNSQHRKFHWKDANDQRGSHTYIIRFHADNDCSGAAIEKDPVIINDM